MNTKHSSLIKIICLLLVSTWLSSCSPNNIETSTVVKTCTLEDCRSNLSIQLAGYLPESFTVKAEDTLGESVIISCRNHSGAQQLKKSKHRWEFEKYSVSGSAIHSNPILSDLAALCGSDAGFILEKTLNKKLVAEIVVQCFEPEVHDTLHYSYCTMDGVAFIDFIPDEVFISVYYEGQEVSELLLPEYTILQPNGPGCEPTCLTGRIELDLIKQD